MSMTPLVSVIMNARNAARYVCEAIDSVLAQTYSNWEIIFWDNCSEDETARLINNYADHRLHYFLAEKFTPLGHARNEAICRAHGEFIAFLDCDDIWLPHKLEFQIPLFEDSSVGLVYSNSRFFNNAGHTQRLYRKRLPCSGECFRQLLGRYFLSMETVVLRRSALEEQPYWFDERFNMIEEADLFRRIGYRWKICGISDPLAMWRVHGNSWTFRHPELLRSESELMIERYCELFPDFKKIYRLEIEQLFTGIETHEKRGAWLMGNKWPLVRHFLNTGSIPSVLKGIAILLWPASQARLALRLKGEVLPE